MRIGSAHRVTIWFLVGKRQIRAMFCMGMRTLNTKRSTSEDKMHSNQWDILINNRLKVDVKLKELIFSFFLQAKAWVIDIYVLQSTLDLPPFSHECQITNVLT